MPTLADVLRQTGYAQDGTLATPTPTESPMTKVLAEHIKSIPQKFNENQAHQMSLLNQAFPGNTYESMMTQGDPKAMAELAMQTPFNAMIAYHGTPHKILGGFDINKVGTGEGAQSYGHGMYFAENPAVAKQYQAALSDTKYKVGERELKGNEAWAAQFLHDFQDDALPKRVDVNTAIKKAQEILKPGETQTEIVNKIKELEKAGLTVENGNLYKVDIPDEYIPNMLDWDKPFEKQSKEVKEILKSSGLYKQYKQNLSDFSTPMQTRNKNARGENIQAFVEHIAGSPEKAAEMLNKLGIKGIRYLDEGSRAKGKGTANFVVFDPSTVKILEENGKPLTRKELIEKQVKELKD